MCKKSTLEDFLCGKIRNSYISHEVNDITYSIYLRKGPRSIDGVLFNKVLDIANITANHPGRGTFLVLLTQIRSLIPEYDGIYVESIMNERFAAYLQALGFEMVNKHYQTINYWKAISGGN